MIQRTNAARLFLAGLLASAVFAAALAGALAARANDPGAPCDAEARVEYPKTRDGLREWLAKGFVGRATRAGVVAALGKSYVVASPQDLDEEFLAGHDWRQLDVIRYRLKDLGGERSDLGCDIYLAFDRRTGRLIDTPPPAERQTSYHIGPAISGAP
jgi:hypothetical protein